jgi:hypothetical protein
MGSSDRSGLAYARLTNASGWVIQTKSPCAGSLDILFESNQGAMVNDCTLTAEVNEYLEMMADEFKSKHQDWIELVEQYIKSNPIGGYNLFSIRRSVYRNDKKDLHGVLKVLYSQGILDHFLKFVKEVSNND